MLGIDRAFDQTQRWLRCTAKHSARMSRKALVAKLCKESVDPRTITIEHHWSIGVFFFWPKLTHKKDARQSTSCLGTFPAQRKAALWKLASLWTMPLPRPSPPPVGSGWWLEHSLESSKKIAIARGVCYLPHISLYVNGFNPMFHHRCLNPHVSFFDPWGLLVCTGWINMSAHIGSIQPIGWGQNLQEPCLLQPSIRWSSKYAQPTKSGINA